MGGPFISKLLLDKSQFVLTFKYIFD